MHRIIPAAVLAAALAVPAAASADSIVYLDRGNVISAEPDGSRKVQLTDEGDWHSVTQADDGTIAAARGAMSIDILGRDGRRLRSIATKPARTGNGGSHRGTPINLAFSPDGKTIAYEYFDVTCPPGSSCPSEQHSVLYTSAAGPFASPKETYGQQFGRSEPSFVSNSRALVFGGFGSGVNVDPLGGGDDSDDLWFTRETDFSDGEVTRDGSRLAITVGYGDDSRLAFMVTRGNPAAGTPPEPQPGDVVCASDADAKVGGGTWAPNGQAAAYESSSGVEVVRFSAFAPGNCGVAGSSVLSATGSEPDWGPAAPPAARYTPGTGVPSGGGSKGSGGGTKGGGVKGGGTKGGTVKAVARVLTKKATRAALRKGLRVKVRTPGAGKVTVRLGKVAKGTTRAKRAGTVTVKLSKVSRRAAAKLRGKRIKLTAVTPGGKVTRKLKVR